MFTEAVTRSDTCFAMLSTRFVTKGHVSTISPSVEEHLCQYVRQTVLKTKPSDEGHYSDQRVPHGQWGDRPQGSKARDRFCPPPSQQENTFQEQGVSEGADRQIPATCYVPVKM